MCWEAVQAAATWGVGCIQIETDCANLITALQTTDFDLTMEGVIFRDLRTFIQLHFIAVDFLFTPRTCNNIAHALTAMGARQTELRLL